MIKIILNNLGFYLGLMAEIRKAIRAGEECDFCAYQEVTKGLVDNIIKTK